jgi:hypothetical protein
MSSTKLGTNASTSSPMFGDSAKSGVIASVRRSSPWDLWPGAIEAWT